MDPRVNVNWIGGQRFVGVDSTKHSVVISTASEGVGMKPSELMLVALAACSSVRCDRSVVLLEISDDALVTSLAEALISPMVSPLTVLAFRSRWSFRRRHSDGKLPPE